MQNGFVFLEFFFGYFFRETDLMNKLFKEMAILIVRTECKKFCMFHNKIFAWWNFQFGNCLHVICNSADWCECEHWIWSWLHYQISSETNLSDIGGVQKTRRQVLLTQTKINQYWVFFLFLFLCLCFVLYFFFFYFWNFFGDLFACDLELSSLYFHYSTYLQTLLFQANFQNKNCSHFESQEPKKKVNQIDKSILLNFLAPFWLEI